MKKVPHPIDEHYTVAPSVTLTEAIFCDGTGLESESSTFWGKLALTNCCGLYDRSMVSIIEGN
jgi:hypothetical protein